MAEENTVETLGPAAAAASRAALGNNPHVRLEALKLAQQVVLENIRNRPVDQREVTVQDITSTADEMMSYITQ